MPGPSSATAIRARGRGGEPSSYARHADLDVPALAAVLDGVVHEVLQHLHDLVAIATDADRAVALAHGDLDLRTGGDRLEGLGDVSRHLAQVEDADAAEDERAHLDAAQRQHVVDEARHARRLARHDAEEARARLGDRRAPGPAASRRSRAMMPAACAAHGWRWR